MKPSMMVYEMKHCLQLLAGSPDGWNGEGAYIPGQPDDKNQLA